MATLLSDMITAMINPAVLIRERRLAAGLSQRELALRARTSAATINRYEAGTIDPAVGTLNRILNACSRRRRRWASIAQLAPHLASTLSDSPQDVWRLVGEMLDDDRGADDSEVRSSVEDPPWPTGNAKADVLVAALGEYLCVRRGLVPPSWTQMMSEVVPWWFVAGERFAALALVESPMSFARRGVFITAGALERV